MTGRVIRSTIAVLVLSSAAPAFTQDLAAAPGFAMAVEGSAAGSRPLAATPVASPVRLSEPVGSVVVDNDAPLVGREVIARQRPIDTPTTAALLRLASRFGLGLPVSARISSGFGMRHHPIDGGLRQHTGLDLAAAYGTPVVSTMTGAVRSSGWRGGYGIMVEVSDGARASTRYAHLSRAIVSAGEAVTRGQVLGYVGSTGHSTGVHLHYELRVDGRPLNPSGNSALVVSAGARLRAVGTPRPILKAVF